MDLEEKQQYLSENLGLVYAVFSKAWTKHKHTWRRVGFTYDDMKQEYLATAYRMLKGWDPDRAQLSTYLYQFLSLLVQRSICGGKDDNLEGLYEFAKAVPIVTEDERDFFGVGATDDMLPPHENGVEDWMVQEYVKILDKYPCLERAISGMTSGETFRTFKGEKREWAVSVRRQAIIDAFHEAQRIELEGPEYEGAHEEQIKYMFPLFRVSDERRTLDQFIKYYGSKRTWLDNRRRARQLAREHASAGCQSMQTG